MADDGGPDTQSLLYYSGVDLQTFCAIPLYLYYEGWVSAYQSVADAYGIVMSASGFYFEGLPYADVYGNPDITVADACAVTCA